MNPQKLDEYYQSLVKTTAHMSPCQKNESKYLF